MIDVLQGHQSLFCNKYESCWQTFQCFLIFQLFMYILHDVIFQFLSYLFHKESLIPPTVVVYYAAIMGQLLYSFQWSLDLHLEELIWKGFFHMCPRPHPPCPLLVTSKGARLSGFSGLLIHVCGRKKVSESSFLKCTGLECMSIPVVHPHPSSHMDNLHLRWVQDVFGHISDILSQE